MRLSVIIPVYNGGEAFRACLCSVCGADPPADEVIVVSDASTDQSDQIAREFGVTLIRTEANVGSAVARNRGVGASTGTDQDILVFLDADVTIPLTLFLQIRAAFESPAAPDALFGSYDDQPAAPGFISQYRNLLHHYVHQTSARRVNTFWTGCGAIRRGTFTAVGGFSVRRHLHDIELGYRLTAAGYRIELHREIQVKHLKRWTLISTVITDIFGRALPWTELLIDYGTGARDLNLQRSNQISLMLVYTLPLILAALIFISPLFWLVLTGAILILLILNWDLYQFYRRVRGVRFALGVVPTHWLLYYGAGGVGVLLGVTRKMMGVRKRLRGKTTW